jgi:hypothetical protein
MCIFQQSAIIRRYLTKSPKMEASKELMNLVDLLKMTDKESFQGGLEDWFQKWQIFLNERSVNLDRVNLTIHIKGSEVLIKA